MLALPDLTLLTFPTSCPWECVYNMPRRILDFLSPIVIELQLVRVLSSASHFIVQFGINFIPAHSPAQPSAAIHNARLHLRSFKKQSGNLILCCVGWEDTFIYHNNKDNSIKTPIIARYNRQDRGNTMRFIYQPTHSPAWT